MPPTAPGLFRKDTARSSSVSLQTGASSTPLFPLPTVSQSKGSVTKALLKRTSHVTCFMDARVVRDLHYVELPQLHRLAHGVESGYAGVLIGVPPQKDLHVWEVMVAEVHRLDGLMERGWAWGLCLHGGGGDSRDRSRRCCELRDVKNWWHYSWLQGEIHFCCSSLLHLDVLSGHWCVTVKKTSWLQQGHSTEQRPKPPASSPPLQPTPPSLNALGDARTAT